MQQHIYLDLDTYSKYKEDVDVYVDVYVDLGWIEVTIAHKDHNNNATCVIFCSVFKCETP